MSFGRARLVLEYSSVYQLSACARCTMHHCFAISYINLLLRWTVGDASIFSVDDGKRLAQTPHKPPTFYERIRLEKQQKAAIQTPLVKGYRLLPEFTPGRAMLWGTILAVWGTAAVVASTAKSLDIKTVGFTAMVDHLLPCRCLALHVPSALKACVCCVSALICCAIQLSTWSAAPGLKGMEHTGKQHSFVVFAD